MVAIQNSKVIHTACPVCNSKEISSLLTVPDFSVSKETFEIWQCAACTLRFTQNAPDENSIGKYYQSPDYISHTNTNKGLVNKSYQLVRNYTLQQKASLIKRFTGKKEGNILDVGCGIGAFLNTMQQQHWQVTGLEPDVEARKKAAQLYGITVQEPFALNDLPQKSFDAITLWHVLEHVHQLHDYIEKLKNLLTPNGKLFIAVPNYCSEDAAAYNMHWAAYDVPRHLYHFTPQSIEVLMQHHNLKVITKKPMWFDSFYISILSSKYKNGTTNWFGAAFTGLQSNLNAALNVEKCSSLIYIIGNNK